MKLQLSLILAILMAAHITTAVGQDSKPGKGNENKKQATCPVMGGKINKNIFVDAKGCRIYVCCKGCLDPIKADPDKYIEKIKAKGEVLEKAPADENNNKEAKK